MSKDTRMVVRGHTSCYPQPVRFRQGDEVDVGKGDDEYPGWVWVTVGSGDSGWAPEEYLEIEGSRAKAGRDYDSTELNTIRGQRVSVVLELCGWALVDDESGSRGWVPSVTLGNPEKK